MPELSAAPSINDTRTQALLVLIARLAALDLTTLLVYRIDSVVASALPLLAWQFDILSPLWQLIAPVALGVDALTNIDLLIDVDNLIEAGGLVTELALTEAAQRDLLKSAIGLHRFRGTPWAIKQALGVIGMGDGDAARRADELGRGRVSVEPGLGGVSRHDRSRGGSGCFNRRGVHRGGGG